MTKNLLFTALIFIFYTLPALAYKPASIKGKVLDEKQAPLAFATVVLKSSSDSTIYKAEVSDDKGIFVFEEIKPGNYFIETQVVGYEKLRKYNIDITPESTFIDIGSLTVKPSSTTLKTVDIKADKPFIEHQIDKTVVNIENSSIQQGSSVMDMMQKMPGVVVSQDDAISLKGKQGVIIMMDGKPSTLSGTDLANMLKGMSAGNVQKVELISNPSAKYDAAGNAGIINIITKKNRANGFNGSATVGYGQGRYQKQNYSVNLNYKHKWYNLFFTYSYSDRKGFNNLILNRRFFRNDTLQAAFNTNNYIVYPFKTHNPRLGADFNLSDKSTLSVLTTGVVNSFQPTADNHSDIYNGGNEKVSSTDFFNRSKDRWYNYGFNAEFKHKIDTTGQEISADVDYADYWNNTSQTFTTLYNDASDVNMSRAIRLGDQRGDLHLYSAKLDYSLPLKNKASFDAGFKTSYVTADNNILFYNNSIATANLDTGNSNHFLYKENINAGYVNYKKEFIKFSYQLGLRAEQTIGKGNQVFTGQKFDRNFFQLFPSVYADYKLTDSHSININLARRIDRPGYQQMNPFRKTIDATTYAEGNPYLLPQLTYNYELTHNYKDMFFTTLGYSITYNAITDVLLSDAVKRITVQSTQNIEQYRFYSINFTFTKKLAKNWTTNTSVLGYYGKYIGDVYNYNLNKGLPSININTTNSFTITDGLSAEISYWYNSKVLYGVTTITPNSSLTIGINKKVLKNQGTLSLNASDIFWNAYPSGFTHFGNVDEDWRSIRETRVVNLSFTYRFGKQSARMRRSTGADDEIKRVGGAG